jgi:undecaprenyl pyrophosphate synthase
MIIHDRRPDSPIRPMPRHIGIILDGNRRHARKQGLSEPCEIYQRGAGKLDDVLNWSAELYIPAVTLWVFSTENLKRSSSEDWCLSFGFGLRTVQRWCALRPGTAHMLIHATMGPTG